MVYQYIRHIEHWLYIQEILFETKIDIFVTLQTYSYNKIS